MDVRKDILFRMYLVYGGVLLLSLVIFVRLIQIKFVMGPELRAEAEERVMEYKKTEPLRGNIFSADGSFLATSVPVFDIRMDTRVEGLTTDFFNKNVDSLAYCLGDLFKDPGKDEFKKILINGRKNKKSARYLLIYRQASFTQLQKLLRFPMYRDKGHKGGLIVETEFRRIKPYRGLASRTIGKVDFAEDTLNMKGKRPKPYGLEAAYDTYLTGTSGVRLMQKLAGGLWKPVTGGYELEPENGSDVYTTLDVNLQSVAHNELQKQLSLHNADHGCVVMMEVKTGEVKAIVNLKRTAEGMYSESFNYAIGESVEPGSTFKLASLMAAMEDNLITLNDSVEVGNGVIQFFKQTMKDSHDGGYGRSKLSVKEIFAKSSNVGISKIIWKYYRSRPEKFVERMKAFHLADTLGLDIAGEGIPRIKTPKDKDWTVYTLPWMSIGYECRLTPLQILNFYNAVANNGVMVKPRFVREIRQRGTATHEFPVEVMDQRIASEATIKQAREMLLSVVEKGTASNLKGLRYTIAGKTGTAQIAGNNGYDKSTMTYRASFVGYFPADKPKYSCIVVVTAPSNSVYYGNVVAGPVFKAVADKVYATSLDIHEPFNQGRMAISDTNRPAVKPGSLNDAYRVLSRLNISAEPQKDASAWSAPSYKHNVVKFSGLRYKKNQIPDVRGMGARDAIFLLENLGMKVSVSGRGAVVSQNPMPGSGLRPGETVQILLGS